MINKIVIAAFIVVAFLFALVTGIGPGPALADSSNYIIEAEDVSALLAAENTVLVDMQDEEQYIEGHIEGAVNIMRNQVVVNDPYPNLLAPAEQVEAVLGSAGIDNQTRVLIYDDSNNMEAARLWWTMKVYGHEHVHVISGGLEALKAAGYPLSAEPPVVTEKSYQAGEPNYDMIATIEDIEEQVDNPRADVILLDTRSCDEFNSGTIPGSIHVDYLFNNFPDGRYKTVDHILIDYKEKGITADNHIIIYCAVSVRGAQTFLALYNAGYRNLSLYDAAWVEYSDIHLSESEEEAETVEEVEEVEEEEEPVEEVEAPGG